VKDDHFLYFWVYIIIQQIENLSRWKPCVIFNFLVIF
jgi:hypothetical protein